MFGVGEEEEGLEEARRFADEPECELLAYPVIVALVDADGLEAAGAAGAGARRRIDVREGSWDVGGDEGEVARRGVRRDLSEVGDGAGGVGGGVGDGVEGAVELGGGRVVEVGVVGDG